MMVRVGGASVVRSKVLSDTKLPPWAYWVARAYWQGATEVAVPPGLVMVIQGRKKSSRAAVDLRVVVGEELSVLGLQVLVARGVTRCRSGPATSVAPVSCTTV